MKTSPRRVPRRSFSASVGVLHRGKYQVGRAFQVGEGGMMFRTEHAMAEGDQLVATFYVRGEKPVIVRGVVRSLVAAKGDLPARFGIEFLNLEFQSRREIRNFVAEATRSEISDF